VVAVLCTIFTPPGAGLAADLLAQPAAWTVPLAFTVMVSVSLATRRRVPSAVGAMLLRLHAPETLHGPETPHAAEALRRPETSRL
jgi:hypothetical protein